MSVNSSGNMREAMPETAAWIDSLRDAFGAEAINPQLRHIHAQENGNTLGNPATHSIAGKPLGYALAVSDMPDIVALLEQRKTARSAYKPPSNKRHK